jgi:hypothetical protein
LLSIAGVNTKRSLAAVTINASALANVLIRMGRIQAPAPTREEYI